MDKECMTYKGRERLKPLLYIKKRREGVVKEERTDETNSYRCS